jgi:hypothetical protein
MLALLMVAGQAATREYTLKRTLDEGQSQSGYSYHQFSVKSFVNDTIAYGDTVTFNIYVDFNKHVPAAPMLYVLFSEAGTTDSLKVTRTIYYSQVSALANDDLGAMQSYYYKAFKARTSALDFNSADYYPVTVADSVTATGLVYPSFSLARSVLYKVTVIPLKTASAVKVKDIRFKLYLNPAQFK